jgi:hypothetical protein
MGALGGFALSALLFGNDFLENGYGWDEYYNYKKTGTDYQSASLSIAMISSIGLGHLGIYLGRTKEWDEGRISLYRHFSLLNSGLASLVTIATKTEDLRWYGGIGLLAASSGYLLADKIADVKNYTRGDLIAASGFTLLTSFFGAGLMTEFEDIKNYQRLALLPAMGALAGTYGSYFMFDNTKLTIQEGRRLNYSIIGSSLIGLGLAIMLDAESTTPYYLLPTITGAIGYAILLNYYKMNPDLSFKRELFKNIDYCISVHPQNYLINRYLDSKNYSKNLMFANVPLFNLQMKFN